MTAGERADSVIWMVDLDGTGSMHPASEGDPGAVRYVREDLAAPKVKPLVWWDDEESGLPASVTPTATMYHIVAMPRTGRFLVMIDGAIEVSAPGGGIYFEDIDSAKAAAQADFENRILSALDGDK